MDDMFKVVNLATFSIRKKFGFLRLTSLNHGGAIYHSFLLKFRFGL
jgi:hypothetical protein